jgi:hypothetical protein
MPYRNLVSVSFVIFATIPFIACAGSSRVALSATPKVAGSAGQQAQGVPGSYELFFLARVNGVLQEVSSLHVDDGELILKAHVADSSGQPAQSGRVTFEYCSFKGLPPSDINRPDEAPSVACEDASVASWDRLGGSPVDDAGDAFFVFGAVHIPRTVGFRFRYTGQGSGISSTTIDPVDFTWDPAP